MLLPLLAKSRSFLAGLALAISLAGPVHAGLIITPTFDSSITNDANAATIMSTINLAIAIYENSFSDPINVNIKFQEGGGLGSSSTAIGGFSYSSYLTRLGLDATTADDATALASLPNTVNNPVDGDPNLWITSANARALGYVFNPSSGFDGTITLNTSIMNLTRPPGNLGNYDLLAVTMHEIDEVLGTGSGLNLPTGFPRLPRPQDLFRYDNLGNRSYTTSGTATSYFSIDGGTTLLVQFNQNGGADYGDWFSTGPHTSRVQDAFGTPGATPDLGVELVNLDVIGYNATTPEPTTVLLGAAGLGLLAALRRRKLAQR